MLMKERTEYSPRVRVSSEALQLASLDAPRRIRSGDHWPGDVAREIPVAREPKWHVCCVEGPIRGMFLKPL